MKKVKRAVIQIIFFLFAQVFIVSDITLAQNPRERLDRPIPTGVSISTTPSLPLIFAGTAGMRVFWNSDFNIKMFLGNNQVLGAIGPDLCPNTTPQLVSTNILEIGDPDPQIKVAFPDMSVPESGFTTGLTFVDESFEGEGLDKIWTTIIGDGCTLNPDDETIEPPWEGGSQVLKCTSSFQGWKAYARASIGSQKPILFGRFYVLIESHDIDKENDKKSIVRFSDGNGEFAVIIYLKYDGENCRFFSIVYNNGAWQSAGYGSLVNINEWYCIEVKYDARNARMNWRVNGKLINQSDIILEGYYRNGISNVDIGLSNYKKEINAVAYYDLIALGDVDWFGLARPLLKKETLELNSDLLVQWDASHGNNHFLLLNDNNDDSSIFTITEENSEVFTLNNPIEVTRGAPISIRLWARITSHNLKRRLLMGVFIGDTFYYEPIEVSDDIENYYVEFTKNPSSGEPWNWDEINELKPMVYSSMIDGGGKISKLWVEVIAGAAKTTGFLIAGPIFGGVSSNKIKVWIKTNQTCNVKIRYGTNENDVKNNLGDTVTTPSLQPVYHDNYCKIFNITEIENNTTYYFTVLIDDQPVHIFESDNPFWNNLPSCKTFAPEGIHFDFDFAFGGDMHKTKLNYSLFKSLAQKNPLFFIDMGDHYQNDTDNIFDLWSNFGRRRGFSGVARNLNLYILSRMPMFNVFSDHDGVANNWHKFGAGNFGGDYQYKKIRNFIRSVKNYFPLPELGAPNLLIGTATGGGIDKLLDDTAYFSKEELYPGMVVINKSANNEAYSFIDSIDSDTHITLSQPLSDNNTFDKGNIYIIHRAGLWYKFTAGDTVFFVLDTRNKRDPNNTPFGDMLDGRKFLGSAYNGNNSDHGGGLGIGHIQRDWLVKGINNSSAKWKFILCELPFLHDEVQANDKWADYDAYDSLRNYLSNNIQTSNVIWLSADRHFIALDDGSHPEDPWPSANSSPLGTVNTMDPEGTWLVDGKRAVFSRKDNIGPSFAIVKVRNHFVTIDMYDSFGNLLNNGNIDMSMTVHDE